MTTEYPPRTVGELVTKYQDLVWYARKPRDEHGKVTLEVGRETMPDTPEDILQGMVASAQRIETLYPAETAIIKDTYGDYKNCFNEGMLAALRMVAPSTKIPTRAFADFPDLDT